MGRKRYGRFPDLELREKEIRDARVTNAPECPNCGEKGAIHFIPSPDGDTGEDFFMCEPE